MNTKQRIAERRRINQALAAQDAANRCAYCKAPLTGVIIEAFLSDGKFCSDECLKAAEDQCVLTQRHP